MQEIPVSFFRGGNVGWTFWQADDIEARTLPELVRALAKKRGCTMEEIVLVPENEKLRGSFLAAAAARQARHEALELLEKAVTVQRMAALELLGQGVTDRDVGVLVGMSRSWVDKQK